MGQWQRVRRNITLSHVSGQGCYARCSGCSPVRGISSSDLQRPLHTFDILAWLCLAAPETIFRSGVTDCAGLFVIYRAPRLTKVDIENAFSSPFKASEHCELTYKSSFDCFFPLLLFQKMARGIEAATAERGRSVEVLHEFQISGTTWFGTGEW